MGLHHGYDCPADGQASNMEGSRAGLGGGGREITWRNRVELVMLTMLQAAAEGVLLLTRRYFLAEVVHHVH